MFPSGMLRVRSTNGLGTEMGPPLVASFGMRESESDLGGRGGGGKDGEWSGSDAEGGAGGKRVGEGDGRLACACACACGGDGAEGEAEGGGGGGRDGCVRDSSEEEEEEGRWGRETERETAAERPLPSNEAASSSGGAVVA